MVRLIFSVLIACCLYGSATAADKKNISDSFLAVPTGCYLMGNTFGDAYHIEMPVHEVCVSRFLISQFPVTRGEFNRFVSETDYRTDAEKNGGCYVYDGSSWEKDSAANWRRPGFQQGDDHPVVCVNWNDAVAYADWLTQKHKRLYRLPTEAEREFAARSAGKQERFAGSDDIDKVAWYATNSDNRTHSVGQKQPNSLGLYDMSGNVWEWTGDWYDKLYYRESPRNNPAGPTSGSKRVFRGGSWFYDQRGARNSYRDFSTPDFSSSYLGFRLVSPLP